MKKYIQGYSFPRSNAQTAYFKTITNGEMSRTNIFDSSTPLEICDRAFLRMGTKAVRHGLRVGRSISRGQEGSSPCNGGWEGIELNQPPAEKL